MITTTTNIQEYNPTIDEYGPAQRERSETSVAYSRLHTYVDVSNDLIDSFSGDFDKLLENSRIHHKKLAELETNIGTELFQQLTQQQKDWIINTEGSIDLGHTFTSTDFQRIQQYLEKEYE